MATILKYTPAITTVDPITFSLTATDYQLLTTFEGSAEMPVSHATVRYFDQNGKTRLNTVAEPRQITFDVMIHAADADELQDLKEALCRCLNPLNGDGLLTYTAENGTNYYLTCISDGNSPRLGSSKQDRGHTYQRATITMIAHDPLWSSEAETVDYLGTNTSDMFPFDFPFSPAENSDTQVINNNGSTIAWPRLIIYGPITDPVIKNNTLDMTISLTTTIADGDRIEINTDPDDRYCTHITSAGVETNAFPYIDLTSKFWYFGVGNNTIITSCTTSSGVSKISIFYAKRYVGV